MDLRDLRYFETIAELEHIGLATKRLHRTQPALTSCIRRLESECGAPLFEKFGRGIRLTDAGRVLLKWAQRTRFDIEDAKREVTDIGRGYSGRIRLGIVPTAAQYLLPQATQRLMKDAPDVTLKTVVALIDVLKPMLRAGELDLMIGTDSPAESGLVSKLLAEDKIVVAASANHEILARRVKLEDLTRYEWALQPPGAPTRDWLDHTFERKGLPRPKIKVESTMLIMLPTLIAETGLLSFISRHHLEGPLAQPHLKEVPLRETTMRRRMAVTFRQNGYLPPAARLFMSYLGGKDQRSI